MTRVCIRSVEVDALWVLACSCALRVEPNVTYIVSPSDVAVATLNLWVWQCL